MRNAWLLFLALVGRHILKHRLRACLTLLGVALGVAVAVAVQLANGSAIAAFERSVRAVAGDARLQIAAGSGMLDETLLMRLAPLTDYADLEPVVEGVAVLAGHEETGFRLLGVDLLSRRAFREYANGAAGAQPSVEGLFITAAAAAKLGLKANDVLPLWINDRRVETHVAGILPTTGSARTLDPMVAFTDVALAQELLGRVGRLDHIDVVPHAGQDLARVAALAKPLLKPGEDLLEPEESNRQAARMLTAFRTNMMALSFVALIVGAYLIYNAVSISVVQRRREVATLRALGVTRAQVFSLFAMEAGAIGLVGSVIGSLLGAFMAGFAVKAVGRTVNALYLAAPVNDVVWTPEAFLMGVAVGVGLSIAAAIAPALDAASTPPALAMRAGSWEARQGGYMVGLAAIGLALLALAFPASHGPVVGGLPVWGYVAATLVLMGCTLLAPIAVAAVAIALRPLPAPGPIWPLALRNFRRAVGRNGGAVAAVMVGMAMTIGVATMVGSFRETVKVWVGNTLPASFYLKPMGAEGMRRGLTLDPAIPEAIRKLPGVAAVESFRNQFVTFDGVTIRLGGGDADVLADHGSLVLRSPGDVHALYRKLIGRQAVLASDVLTIKHGVHVGDTMRLPTPHGILPFTVEGTFLDYSSDQGYVLMDRGTYARLWDDPAITDVAVYAAPGADLGVVRGEIQKVVGARPIRLEASGELRDEVLRVFDNTFAITYALHVIAIAVSLLGVVSTLFALVLERQRELSVMRYVGLTTRQVRHLVLAESGLLGLTGALVGLLCGGLLSAILIEVINKQSFGWSVDWHPPWGFIGGALLSLMAAALLAGLYPAGVAARLPVAEGLRRE
ncbi:MAG: conserved rane protein of unknown function [Cyanobacteria bacterium RYN_339]|nr:conserved rane protein of unknown function [Cyanobacteria bacterium RYN_339]